VKQIELMILAALGESPAHGYALAQRVAELTGARLEVRPGNLYRVLDRMEQRGWVKESDAGGATDDERRRYYSLTGAGRRAADAELNMYADVLARTRGMRERRADG
jgi:DNA-binding PadR family transcriptional regulator